MKEIKNAIISNTMLGYEDHGILSSHIYLDYGGSGQGFVVVDGGYQLLAGQTLQTLRKPKYTTTFDGDKLTTLDHKKVITTTYPIKYAVLDNF